MNFARILVLAPIERPLCLLLPASKTLMTVTASYCAELQLMRSPSFPAIGFSTLPLANLATPPGRILLGHIQTEKDLAVGFVCPYLLADSAKTVAALTLSDGFINPFLEY